MQAIQKILNDAKQVKLLVIGDVMLDKYIWGDTSRISPEAPVPVVKVSSETYTAGGAANVALNIATLGAKANLFGWIGVDDNGEKLTQTITNQGVVVVPGSISKEKNTIVKTRVVCRRQQVCRLDSEDSPDCFQVTPYDIATKLAPAIKEADAIILSDYAKGIITTETIKQIQSIARPETIIALDPKPRPSISYTGLSVMTPNRSEAYKLAGINEDEITDFPAELVCKRIYEKFSPKSLIITLGADGMLLSENGEVVSKVPTYAREVFDVSGAGDTVIAALSVALATGASMLDAIHFANTAAGYVVGKLGTATATPEDIIAYASNK